MKEKAMKETKITISLPSLIHRIGGDHAKRAKTLAAEKQCDLKRIRRSRHWQISGEALDVKAFLEHLKNEEAETMRFAINKIEQSSTCSPRQIGTFGREVDTFGETKPKHHPSGADG